MSKKDLFIFPSYKYFGLQSLSFNNIKYTTIFLIMSFNFSHLSQDFNFNLILLTMNQIGLHRILQEVKGAAN